MWSRAEASYCCYPFVFPLPCRVLSSIQIHHSQGGTLGSHRDQLTAQCRCMGDCRQSKRQFLGQSQVAHFTLATYPMGDDYTYAAALCREMCTQISACYSFYPLHTPWFSSSSSGCHSARTTALSQCPLSTAIVI